MTITHEENEAIIGRASINDIEAILATPLVDPTEVVHVVKNNADSIFTWDYSLARPQLRKLYEKAKTGQWNGTTDLPWDMDVDVEKTVAEDQALIGNGIDPNWYAETPLAKWGDKEWLEFGIQSRKWSLSQFLHGEQGALICTAKITETVPWYDAKLYASTQVVDEARHVEVFARYLDEKLGGGYPINAHLEMLLDDIIKDSRWDFTYLGMQIMVEGLALAAFGYLHQLTNEPLLKQLLRYVMSDEARHVAFGVLSLKEVYDGMSDAEIKDRQEFAYEASIRMRDRFLQQEVWRHMGVDPKVVVPLMVNDPGRKMFQQLLFAKIVPNCKKLGLLDRNDKWLRHRFEEMGVIQFENMENTGEEYLQFELGKDMTPAAH
ncbi:MAG: ferritin-like domain-containing protein [Ilumatobacteraceae bacterium]